jgi:adenosylmethionine-8-amino-7-oxononanoate aminotransferase
MGIEWVGDRERDVPFDDPEAVKARAVQLGREHGVHFYGGPPSSLIWIPPSNIEDGPFDHLLSAVEAVVAGIEREFAR